MPEFKIASAILGGVPVLVNMLDYYEWSLSPFDEWWNFQRRFMEFVNDVRHQRMLFQQNLELLLDPVIDDNEKVCKSSRRPWEAGGAATRFR